MDPNLARAAWVLLLAVGVLALVGCATGAMGCAVGKPVGIAAAIGAGVISLFDPIGAGGRSPRA